MAKSEFLELPREEVERLFMESQHLSWKDFCQEKGWNYGASRSRLPVAEWSAKKRRAASEEYAQELKEVITGHRLYYRKDVLLTLREYPRTNDAIHNLIRFQVNALTKEISENPNATRTKISGGKEFQVPILDTDELVKLALAMKTITEAKHKSLMLSDVVAKVSSEAPADSGLDIEEESQKQAGLLIEVRGHGPVSLADLRALQDEYMDRPQQQEAAQHHDPIPLENGISQELLELDKDGTDVPSQG